MHQSIRKIQLLSNISCSPRSLEQALRNFSTLTQGDMIEIVYNSMVFEILIMEIKPDGAGINLIDTDLEVFSCPNCSCVSN